MNRVEIINYLLAKTPLHSYLEIGVKAGSTFLNIRSSKKVAVDPDFKIKPSFKAYKYFKYPAQIASKYYDLTSDDFFREIAPKRYGKRRVDIVLVDGMHTYENAFRDIVNALAFLNEDGVILVHDSNPATASAEVSFADWANRGFSGVWNGDVWKAIYHIREKIPHLNAFVVDNDYGVGIITKKKGAFNNTDSKIDEKIAALSYDDLAANREKWLGLTSVDECKIFLEEFASQFKKK